MTKLVQIGDAVILIGDVQDDISKQFSLDRLKVFSSPQGSARPKRFKDRYQAYNAEVEMCAVFATRNSLKLQEV